MGELRLQKPFLPHNSQYAIRCHHSKSKKCPYSLSFRRVKGEPNQWEFSHCCLDHANHKVYTINDRQLKISKQLLASKRDAIEKVYLKLYEETKRWMKPKPLIAHLAKYYSLQVLEQVDL
jgi:hypothetical protein